MWKIIRKNLKVIKTCNLYFGIFSVGLCMSITGPCLLDLQRMVDTDTQHIALIYTSRSIGFLVGAIVGGILLDIVRSKFAVLTVCNLMMTVTMFGIPWSRSVNTLVSFSVFNGLSLGALEVGSNVICIELWGSGPYLQALHFTFGLGGLVSPLIAAPFLEYQNDIQTSNNSSNFSNIENFYSNFSSYSPIEEIPKITYPFSIIGTFCLLVTIQFFVTFLESPIDEHASSSDTGNKSNRGWFFVIATSIFTFLIFFVVAGSELGFAQTLTTFVVKGPLQSTTTLGSYMTSSYWAAFTIMRLISIFLSVKISNIALIITDILLVAVSGIILIIFIANELALWAACITFGVGIASAYPSFAGWLSNYIEITNKMSATFTVGVAAGEMVYPFIIAYFLEVVPQIFVYVIASTSILIVILLLILYCIFKDGKKNMKSKETKCHAVNNDIVLGITVDVKSVKF